MLYEPYIIKRYLFAILYKYLSSFSKDVVDVAGKICDTCHMEKRAPKKREKKPFVPVPGADELYKQGTFERVERRATIPLIALTTLAAVVGPHLDSAANRRQLSLRLERLWDTLKPMNPEEKDLARQLQEAAKGEATLPRSTARTKMDIEAAHGDRPEEEIERAAQEYERRLDSFSTLAEAENPYPLFRAVVRSFGEYEETRSYTTDLLNGNGGNCEARAYYACGMLEELVPELAPRLSFDTLWVKNEQGELEPHIRCVLVNDDGTITPIEGNLTPETVEHPPAESAQVQLARSFLLRHDALPAGVELPAIDTELPTEAPGTKPKVRERLTDTLLLYPVSNKVQPYKPGVVDSKDTLIASKEPVEVFLHHMAREDWEAIARDANHPMRKELFKPRAEDWRPTELSTALEVEVYAELHYLGPFTPMHVRLTTQEAHQEFRTYARNIAAMSDLILVPEWAGEEYGNMLYDQVITRQLLEGAPISHIVFTGSNAQEMLERYFHFRLSNDERVKLLIHRNDIIHLRSLEQFEPERFWIQMAGSYQIDVLTQTTLQTLVETDFLDRYLHVAEQIPPETFSGLPLVLKTARKADGQAIKQKLQELAEKHPNIASAITLKESRIPELLITKEELDYYTDQEAMTKAERDEMEHFLLLGIVPMSDQAALALGEKYKDKITAESRVGVHSSTSPEAAKRLLAIFLQGAPAEEPWGKKFELFDVWNPSYILALHYIGVGDTMRAYKATYPESADHIGTEIQSFLIAQHPSIFADLILEESISPIELTVDFAVDPTEQSMHDLCMELAAGLPKRDYRMRERGLRKKGDPAKITFSPNYPQQMRLQAFTETKITDRGAEQTITTIRPAGLSAGEEVILRPGVPIEVVIRYEQYVNDIGRSYTQTFTVGLDGTISW